MQVAGCRLQVALHNRSKLVAPCTVSITVSQQICCNTCITRRSALTSLIAVHFADLKFALSQVVLDLKVITNVAVKVLQGGRDAALLHISNILTAALRTLF